MSDLLLLSSALAMALLGSGHCFSMCGALSALAGRERMISYQLGRGVGYLGLGAFFGYFGKSFFSFLSTHPEIEVLALISVLFIFFIQLLTAMVGSWDHSLVTRAYRAFHRKLIAPIAHSFMRIGGFGMGLGNAFLPCGFFLYFGSIAAVTGSPAKGSLLFLMLWLGSLPALLFATVGYQSIRARISRPAYRRAFLAILLIVGVISLDQRIEKAHSMGAASSLPSFSEICGLH